MLIAGCWDRRELEERSNVLAAGVDLCVEGEDCALVSTRQIAIPGQIPLGAERAGARQADTVVVIRTPAADSVDSVARAQAELNRQMTFGHSRILVISEAFARRGLEQYVDFVRRLPEVRRLIWMAIAEGRAEEILKAKPDLEEVPALFLNDMFDDAVRSGRLPPVNMGNFLTRTSSLGEEAVVPILRMGGPNQPEVAGLAVFRGYRMVGKLTPDETATYLELQGIRRGGELLEIPLSAGQGAALSVFGRLVRYRVRWVEGRVRVHVAVNLETKLERLSPDLEGSDPSVAAAMERQAEKLVAERGLALVRKLQQEYGADILAVGERVRAYLPGAWAAIPDWPAAFARAEFSIDVQVHLRQSGPSMK